MFEVVIIICCSIVASKFKKAGEKGASKYILGAVITMIISIASGMIMYITDGADSDNIAVMFVPILIGYSIALIIAIAGIVKGNELLRNSAYTRVTNTEQELR